MKQSTNRITKPARFDTHQVARVLQAAALQPNLRHADIAEMVGLGRATVSDIIRHPEWARHTAEKFAGRLVAQAAPAPQMSFAELLKTAPPVSQRTVVTADNFLRKNWIVMAINQPGQPVEGAAKVFGSSEAAKLAAANMAAKNPSTPYGVYTLSLIAEAPLPTARIIAL